MTDARRLRAAIARDQLRSAGERYRQATGLRARYHLAAIVARWRSAWEMAR